MRPATATARLLVRCVTEHDWAVAPDGVAELADRSGPGRVAAAAEFHGVDGCVHHSLAPVVDPTRFAALGGAHRRSIDRHVRALGDLAAAAPALDDLGVPWLVVKGPVLAEAFYPRPDLRSYSDLDVVVPASALGDVLAAVEGTGGRVLDRNWRLLRELEVGQILLRMRHGTLLDLHWQLFNTAAVRRSMRGSMAELFERARLVRVGANEVRTLDAVDTLLHLSIHGTLSGGHRLLWLKDVERAVASDGPAWDEVVRRARAWGAGPAVALALSRAARVVGAAVPPGVPEALAGGRSYLAVAAAADRLAPPERSRGKRSLSLMVSRSARADTASTAAELARRMAAAVTDKRRLSLEPPKTDMDPANPASPRYEQSSDADRRAFLEAITARGG
ncbi:MAG TPA: nucleotidyltransferase family protein [Acidimicrobiales bacterium]|nr:nucleotidyltransferase family protein [Acidimicrobiales bacterium]